MIRHSAEEEEEEVFQMIRHSAEEEEEDLIGVIWGSFLFEFVAISLQENFLK